MDVLATEWRMTDQRLEALTHWGNRMLERELAWYPASTDASFRRYFRATAADSSWIAMDAPPQQEDNTAFVRIARLFAAAGLHTPEVLAWDRQRGFLLLTDLGRQTYLDVLHADNADDLFDAAIDALVTLQVASRPHVLPVYDRNVLRAELMLFRDWYLPCHLRRTPSTAEAAALDTVFDALLDNALAQPRVYVHRDYMPRNLMLSVPLPGIIDFQDAMYGPVTYDIACLFRDAFISWPEQRVHGWLRAYWQRARQAGVPVADAFETFQQQTDLMGVQRHLKVLGIFARIAHRDGKPR